MPQAQNLAMPIARECLGPIGPGTLLVELVLQRCDRGVGLSEPRGAG